MTTASTQGVTSLARETALSLDHLVTQHVNEAFALRNTAAAVDRTLATLAGTAAPVAALEKTHAR